MLYFRNYINNDFISFARNSSCALLAPNHDKRDRFRANTELFIYNVFVKNKWYPEPIPYGRGFHSLLTPFGVQTRASLQTTTLRVASEPILDLFIYKVFVKNKWCPEPESNQRHVDFQSTALPTELSGQT